MPENVVECESFIIASTDSLIVSGSKCFLEVYLDNCAYKIERKKITCYLDDILFVTDED